MKIKAIFIITSVFYISGCSSVPWITPPGTDYTVINSRSYDMSYDEVWGNVTEYITENRMQLKSVDKTNGLINAEMTSFEDDIADCGLDSTMKVTERRVNLDIFVNQTDENIVVSVNNEFKETREMLTASDTVTCNSKGVIESRILSAASS